MNQENRESYIYDIETLKSCFTLTVLNIDTQKIKQFTLHKNRWEFKELIEDLNIMQHIEANAEELNQNQEYYKALMGIIQIASSLPI